MSVSIRVTIPRVKSDKLEHIFNRIRYLYGITACQISRPDDSLTAQTSGIGQSSEDEKSLTNVVVCLTMTETANKQNLLKAKEYLLSASNDDSSKCQRRCQYATEIYQQLMSIQDDVEKETAAAVVFESNNQVIVSGSEPNVQAAIQLLDSRAQELVRQESKKSSSSTFATPRSEKLPSSLFHNVEGASQSRDVFRQCRNLESEDSSYDSDYENSEPLTPRDAPDSHHDDVSRTVSDTLAAEYAEYVTQPCDEAQLQKPQDTSGSSRSAHCNNVRDLSAILSDPHYTSRVEFALKLGYTEEQVQIVLQKLGAQPSQNELLAELIKLGATCKGAEKGSEDADTIEAGGEITRPDVSDDSANLRHIVIDGSNVAMSHGNKECFSCRGIKLCVDWFKARGHKEITVFVPRWRKEASRPDAPIKDQDILVNLEKERMLVFTPSRHIGGRRMVCYDDRYILKLALEEDGIIVSNDNYRDLVTENPEYKKVVEERLLMYSFVNDRFMPPDDPLGRHGPSLENFLRKQIKITETLPPSCPYGKKCTYGNKCKYYHPERGNLPQKSVTERLAEQAKLQIQEVKSRGLKSRESSPGDKLKNQSSLNTTGGKPRLTRTKSLGLSVSLPGDVKLAKPEHIESIKDASEGECSAAMAAGGERRDQIQVPTYPLASSAAYHSSMGVSFQTPGGTSWPTTVPQISLGTASALVTATPLTTTASSWAAISPTLPQNIPGSRAEMFLEPDSGGHLFVAKRLSDPDSHSGVKSNIKAYQHIQQATAAGSQVHGQAVSSSVQEEGSSNLHRKLQRQLTLNPGSDPRLSQIGGYVDRQRLLSPQQDHYAFAQHGTDPLIGQRASSQENIHMLQCSYGAIARGNHKPLARVRSDGRVTSLQIPSHLDPWEGVNPSEHQTVTRIASAPDSYHQWPPTPFVARMQHLNSTSDTKLNLYPEVQPPTQHPGFLRGFRDIHSQQHRWQVQGAGIDSHTPITSSGNPVWQDPSTGMSLSASQVQNINQPVRPSSVPPPGMQLGPIPTLATPRARSPDIQDDARHRLYYHLSSIFPAGQVRAAMDLYPEETNPQKICAAILTMFPKG